MSVPHREQPLRVLLYSHDSQGLGHLRRNLALAHSLARQLPRLTGRPVTGLLLTGLAHAGSAALPDGFDVVVLPGLRKGRDGYAPRHVRVPMTDLLKVRGQMLSGVVDGFRPDLVVIDRHAHGVDGELRAALTRLRVSRPRARVVLGLRDVLDSPAVAAAEWEALGGAEALRPGLDEIWVYGDPAVHDVRRSGELPCGLQDLVRYTGYLATGRHWQPEPEPSPTPTVVTTVGGGGDGVALCRVAAQAPVPPGHRHLVVTGPQMPDHHRREVELLAGARTEVVDRVPDGFATVRGARAVVAMAGYNTVTEVLATQVPALLVPRERPRREQQLRATGLAAVGAVETCPQDQLTPQRLGAWLAGAVGRSVDRSALDRRGLPAVARRAADLLTSSSVPTQEVSGVAG